MTIMVLALVLVVRIGTFAKDAAAASGSDASADATAAKASGAGCGAVVLSGAQLPALKAVDQGSGAMERTLLEDLRRRRSELDHRQQALDERQLVLDAVESRIQARMTQMTDLRSRIEQLDVARREREEANWTGLVGTYQSMKAEDAANIFDALDMHIVLEVLDRMTERKAASILAAMLPERARQATQLLADARLRREVVPAPAAVSALQ